MNTADSLDVLAARIALHAVRESVRPAIGQAVDSIVLRSGGIELGQGVAEQTLARFPKPLRCTAEISEGRLVVDCRVLSGSEAVAHERYVQVVGAGFPMGELLMLEDTPHVTVIAHGDIVAIPAAGVRRWMRNYQLPPAVGIAWTPPGDGQREDAYVLKISHPEDVRLDRVPDHLRNPRR